MKKLFIIIFSLAALFFAIYGISTEKWFLTAIPIGFLFGFFLQKGDLCAASAMSEAIMFKDRSKLWGFWVAIVTTMLAFAIISSIDGLITLNPKPLAWLSAIIGGIIFGTGMVFAGGCVSGVSYKAATGNINSIMALMAAPVGIASVEYGPLSQTAAYLNSFLVVGSNNEVITLSYLTGIPFQILALIFVFATLAYTIFKMKRKPFGIKLTRSWKPWIAGILIGILGAFAYISSAQSGRNYPLGVTHGILYTYTAIVDQPDNLNFVTDKKIKPINDKIKPQIEQNKLINELIKPQIEQKEQKPEPRKKINAWLILLFLSLLAGSWVSAALSGQAKLLPRDPKQTIVALIGGLLIGMGAALAGGCSIGNILSGWGLMSVGNIIFGIVVLLANWTTTYFYLMGGKIGK